jgi:hypothetical protein
VTAKTPVFQLEYIVPGEPLRNTRAALENNAKSIEAALLAGPASPPNAQDLATLAGRVTALEPGAWTAITGLTAPWVSFAGAGGSPGAGPYDTFAYRVVNGRVWLRGWLNVSGSTAIANGTTLTTAPLPVGIRPPKSRTIYPIMDQPGTTYPLRVEVHTSGNLYVIRGPVAGSYVSFDQCSWALT